MPFSVKTEREGKAVDINDEDLAEIVDLTRAALQRTPDGGSEPIRSIGGDGDTYDVNTGRMRGMRDGYGHIVTLKRVNGRLQVVAVAIWVS
jgi:hypothetical protein